MTSSTNSSFFNGFVSQHKRLKPSEEAMIIRQYRYIADLKRMLLKEKERIQNLLDTEDGLSEKERLDYAEDIESIDNLLISQSIDRREAQYRNKLIEHNLRLVLKNAGRYNNKGLPYEDLVQEGVIGFIRAIEKFDPDNGVRLGTYASWWIKQRMTKALSTMSRIIRLPTYVAGQVTKIVYILNKYNLEASAEQIPFVADIANMDEDKVAEIFSYIHSFYPINQVTGPQYNTGDSDTTEHLDPDLVYEPKDPNEPSGPYAKPDAAITTDWLIGYFNQFINDIHLTPKEIRIFRDFNGLNGAKLRKHQILEELKSEETGWSPERVKQVLDSANSKILQHFLGNVKIIR